MVILILEKGCRGRDHIVVGFITTCAISAYHHLSCEFEPRSWRGVLDTTLCDQVCQWLATGQWFSPGTPFSTSNKTDRHDITEILLKVTLNTINQPTNQSEKRAPLKPSLGNALRYCKYRYEYCTLMFICILHEILCCNIKRTEYCKRCRSFFVINFMIESCYNMNPDFIFILDSVCDQ